MRHECYVLKFIFIFSAELIMGIFFFTFRDSLILLVFPGIYYLNFRYTFILQYKFLMNKQAYERAKKINYFYVINAWI